MAKEQIDIFDNDDYDLFDKVAGTFGSASEEDVIENNDVNLEDENDPDNTNDDTKIEDTDTTTEDTEEEVVETDVEPQEEVSFTPYAKFLAEQGILTQFNEEGFDGSSEALMNAMRGEIQHHVDQYINQFPEQLHNLAKGIQSGVGIDEMINITSEKIKYDSIKDENLETNASLQKDLVRKFLDETTQFSDDMKTKWITNLEDTAQLEEEAKNALTSLKEIQSNKELKAIEDRKAEEKAYYEGLEARRLEFKNTLEKTNEVIPGMKVSPAMKATIEKNLSTAVAQDEYGNPLNKMGKWMHDNQIQGEIILNYLFEATKEFSDWGALSKTGKSQVLKELENAARTADSRSGGVKRSYEKPNNTQGFLNAVKQFNISK